MLRTAPSGVLACLLFASLVSGAAGCGHPAERGPAWPKPAASETDGGESLAPRQPSAVAALEDAGDASSAAGSGAAKDAGSAAPAAAPAAKADHPDDAPAAREPDVLMTEDIVIEIDD